ncbi:2-oxo-4-hydroxy-4-carboxy-5-ureidoimidazoline decarboxylase [Frigoribacterium sp. ME-P-080]|uniref:2-oxo-4-hydroxy-4-carboxy-5-ureidoimidazoline decarboxylase n=1 Tax=Frigoribacterium sp. ME-P-080 TaxID=3040289 RepID=UPI00254B3265|nr:2-oxo-4-hydroxy-4-carboxy-5-ureidoimidazoline decarboxylase [Frigoribacterium sp. ME-P-080]
MIELDDATLRSHLLAALNVERWADDVAAQSPFADADALITVAAAAATPLSAAEIDEAMAHHPRIGEKPVGDGAAQEFSRREQGSAADADDETLAQLLVEGNAAYEQRFDRVFLIRAAGRSRAEIVGELHRRLGLDDDTELRIVGAELRDIALLRLQSTFAGSAPAGSAPAGSAPAGSAPAGSAPAGSAPAGSASAGSAPAGSASAGHDEARA